MSTSMDGGSAGPIGRARSGVLCVGTLDVDLAKVIDSWPTPQQLAIVESVTVSTGGPGLNLAVDLARLGAPFPLALGGLVGDDEHGRYLVAECAALGIDTSGIRTTPAASTSFTDAMVVRGGDARTFFHHAGANDHLHPDDLPIGTSSARILHCGAPGLHAVMDAPMGSDPSGWVRLLRTAREVGFRTNLELVSLPADRLRALARPCLPYLDYLVINDVEAAAVAGVGLSPAGADGPTDWAALEASALGAVALGVARLVVVHCPAGCVAAAPGGRSWRQGSVRLPAGEIRNATGAGDAVAAGVLLGLHEEWPVEDCLRLGMSAAAASLRGAATGDAILPAADCLALGERLGFRVTTG